MRVEDRFISDLADQNIDNTVPETEADFPVNLREIEFINSNQRQFSPQLNNYYEPDIQRTMAAIIVEKVDEDNPEDFMYRVLTQENRLKECFSLNLDTVYQAGDEVNIHPPKAGQVWVIVGEKLHRSEEAVELDFEVQNGAIAWLFQNTQLIKDEEFWTINDNKINLPKGQYEIFVLLETDIQPRVVKLVQTGGSAGDENGPCTFTYDVYDRATNTLLASAYDPMASGAMQRPTKGELQPATSGLWHAGTLIEAFEKEVVVTC